MNCKGSFTAIIGAALVLLLAAIGFTYYANGVSQKAMLEQQDSLELRQHWSNVRYLLDKAAAEALYDTAGVLCTPATDYSAKLRNYFGDATFGVLKKTNSVISCEIPNLNSVTAIEGTGFSFQLKCSRNNSLVSYQNQVALKKSFDNTSGCKVKDDYSGLNELPQ